jgi:hypothetical protein
MNKVDDLLKLEALEVQTGKILVTVLTIHKDRINEASDYK